MEKNPDPTDATCECRLAGSERRPLRSGKKPRMALHSDLWRFTSDNRGRMSRRDLVRVLATIGGLTAVGASRRPY